MKRATKRLLNLHLLGIFGIKPSNRLVAYNDEVSKQCRRNESRIRGDRKSRGDLGGG